MKTNIILKAGSHLENLLKFTGLLNMKNSELYHIEEKKKKPGFKSEEQRVYSFSNVYPKRMKDKWHYCF